MVSKDVGSDWGAYVPDLPGCVATGKTLDTVVRRIQGGIQLHLKGLRHDGLPIPQPRSAIPARSVRSHKEVNFYATVEVAA